MVVAKGKIISNVLDFKTSGDNNMTNKQLEPEYIITKSQLQELVDGYVYAQAYEVVCIEKLVSSRLLSEHDQQVRQKVLDELDRWCTPEDNELDRPAKHKGDYVHASGRLRKKIETLRKNDGEVK